jgi:molecular chaperone DnaJ
MRLEQDYYDVLGVTRGATEDEIKKAFRGLARRLHPDVATGEPGGDPFHEVVAAYHVLSHPRRRRLYDRLGLGGRRQAAARPAPGAPPLPLDLEWYEAERGTSRPVEFEETHACPECLGRGVPRGVRPALCVACHGSGRHNRVTETAEMRLLEVSPCGACDGRGGPEPPRCESCGGSGRKTEPTTIRLRIPPGVHDGDLIQVDGVARRFLLHVEPRPRDSRLVLAVSAAALAAAVALLLYLVVFR